MSPSHNWRSCVSLFRKPVEISLNIFSSCKDSHSNLVLLHLSRHFQIEFSHFPTSPTFSPLSKDIEWFPFESGSPPSKPSFPNWVFPFSNLTHLQPFVQRYKMQPQIQRDKLIITQPNILPESDFIPNAQFPDQSFFKPPFYIPLATNFRQIPPTPRLVLLRHLMSTWFSSIFRN